MTRLLVYVLSRSLSEGGLIPTCSRAWLPFLSVSFLHSAPAVVFSCSPGGGGSGVICLRNSHPSSSLVCSFRRERETAKPSGSRSGPSAASVAMTSIRSLDDCLYVCPLPHPAGGCPWKRRVTQQRALRVQHGFFPPPTKSPS